MNPVPTREVTRTAAACPPPKRGVALYCTVASAILARSRHTRAQATVEYVLVLLGAAAIALLLLAAIAKSDKVGQLLDAVFDSIVGKVA